MKDITVVIMFLFGVVWTILMFIAVKAGNDVEVLRGSINSTVWLVGAIILGYMK